MHNTFLKANRTAMNALFLGDKRWQTAQPQANLQITAVELDPLRYLIPHSTNIKGCYKSWTKSNPLNHTNTSKETT